MMSASVQKTKWSSAGSSDSDRCLEDAMVIQTALALDAPVRTINYRDFNAVKTAAISGCLKISVWLEFKVSASMRHAQMLEDKRGA
jgi:hypothetical protein